MYICTRILVYTHNIYWYIQCNTYYKIMIGSNYRNMFLFNSFGPSQRREEISNPIFPGFPNQNQGNTINFNCICNPIAIKYPHETSQHRVVAGISSSVSPLPASLSTSCRQRWLEMGQILCGYST